MNTTSTALAIATELVEMIRHDPERDARTEHRAVTHLLARLAEVAPDDQQAVVIDTVIAAASIASGLALALGELGDDVDARLAPLMMVGATEAPDDISELDE